MSQTRIIHVTLRKSKQVFCREIERQGRNGTNMLAGVGVGVGAICMSQLEQQISTFLFFVLGDSRESEFYMPTFRNTLFHLHKWCK
jgi:hypothetical protein